MKRELCQIALAIFLFSILFTPSNIYSKIDSTAPILINTPPSDVYADELIDSLTVFIRYGENALGAPDSEYTELFQEYGNGYITLDMGEYEKIWNDTGDDFTVHSYSGAYLVKVGNNIHQPLLTIGEGSDTTSFDLNDTGLEYAQYVQIHYSAGGEVYLDAVEALHLEELLPDTNPPDVTPINDFSVYDNETEVEFTWTVTDEHPWNYVITINDNPYSEGLWIEGEEITFSYTVDGPKNLTIEMTAYDFFGYNTVDTVVLEIKALNPASALPVVLSLIALIGVSYIFKKRNR